MTHLFVLSCFNMLPETFKLHSGSHYISFGQHCYRGTCVMSKCPLKVDTNDQSLPHLKTRGSLIAAGPTVHKLVSSPIYATTD